ncbi:MAG: hypothetical protein R3B47_15660 [Bacteroidia bacterium]
MANYIGLYKARPAVGSAAFEAEFEIQNCRASSRTAARLLDPSLDDGARADILAEVNHLEMEPERHAANIGCGGSEIRLVALSPRSGRSNPAALAAGYPNPPAVRVIAIICKTRRVVSSSGALPIARTRRK